MIVLAVDPGVATGWVVFEPITQVQINVLHWRETVGEFEFYRAVKMLPLHLTPEFCVCEDWKPRGGYRTWHAEPLWIAGAMRMRFGTTAVAMQMPGDALEFGTADKIAPYVKDVPKTKDDHARMALRHALLWTSNQRWL